MPMNGVCCKVRFVHVAGAVAEDGDTSNKEVTVADGTVTVVVPPSSPTGAEPEKQPAQAQESATATGLELPAPDEDRKSDQPDEGTRARSSL